MTRRHREVANRPTLLVVLFAFGTIAAGCSDPVVGRSDRDMGTPDAGAADAFVEEDVPSDVPGDVDDEVDALDDGPAGGDADEPDLAADVPADHRDDAPDARLPDGPGTDGQTPFNVFDAGPDPTVPRLCFDTDAPRERFAGFYIPFCQTGVEWPESIIPTCWSEESARRPDFETLSRSVESFVRQNFNRPTNIDFIGWKVCEPRSAGTTDGGPPAGRLVLSLTDETRWAGNLGYGAGGDRHIVFGVASGFLESQIIESFTRILGLTYRNVVRRPSPSTLSWEELAGLQMHFGRRRGGAILGREARCLAAQPALDNPDGGTGSGTDGSASAADGSTDGSIVSPPPVVLGAPAQVAECSHSEWQDWQFDQNGAAYPIGSRDFVLEADPAAATVRVARRRENAPEQAWSIKRAFLMTDGLKCMGVPGSNFFEGQSVTVGTCNGSAGQEWDIDLKNGKITHGEFCLGVTDGIAAAGNTIQVQRCRNTPAQSFVFRSNGQIHFENFCLNVFSGTFSDGSLLGLWGCANMRHLGNEIFYLNGQIQNGDRCLEMPADRTSSTVRFRTCEPSESQRWDIHMRIVAP